jgi:hypothetical protein
VNGPGSTTFYVPIGTTIQFTASPNSGVTFTGWSGSGTGSYSGSNNPVSVTVNYPVSETADFAVVITFQERNLGSDATGTVVTVNGVSYSYAGSQTLTTISVPYGTQVSYSYSQYVYSTEAGKRYVWTATTGLQTAEGTTFTATQGGAIIGWYGGPNGQVGIQYLLTIQVSPSGAGTTNPAPGSYWEPAGTQVQISASANSGYQFYQWAGSGSGSYSGSANTATVTMNGPVKQTAYFQRPPVTIKFAADGLGSDAQGAVLTVNGGSYGYSSLPLTLTVPYGSTVSYSWASPVPGAAGVQYVWASTSGLATAQSGSFTATQSGSVTATYQKQVQVTVQYISGSAPGSVAISGPYSGTLASGSVSFWVPVGSTVSLQASQGQDPAGYPTLFQWYYDSGTGSTITATVYSFNPSSPDTISVAYDYTGYVAVYAETYVSGTFLEALVGAYAPANTYYYWTPPPSISAYGESLGFVSGPSYIWVSKDQVNTATDTYQEPAQWQNLNLQVVWVNGFGYAAQTTGYLTDPATGGGIGGQTVWIQYKEYFYGNTGGGGPPPDTATTGANGYFFNQQGMGANLIEVQAQISWNPPSYYCNPGTATLEVSGYWP